MRITRSHFEQVRFVVGTVLSCASILFFSQMSAQASGRARRLVENASAKISAQLSGPAEPAFVLDRATGPFTHEIYASFDVVASADAAIEQDTICLDPDSQILKLQDELAFEKNQQLATADFVTATALGTRLDDLLRAPESVTVVEDSAAGCFDEWFPISPANSPANAPALSPEVNLGVQTLAALQ